MRQHGRDDVGVVDLLATYGNRAAQRDEGLGDHGPILKYLEAASQSDHVVQRVLKRDGDWPRLRPCYHRQGFPYNLSANPQQFIAIERERESLAISW